MQKIDVDLSGLDSAISYFVLASKELDELAYRLKIVGNEMVDDIDLQMAVEYEEIMQNYITLSKNIRLIQEEFESIGDVLSKVPETYYDVEQRSIAKINNLIAANEKKNDLTISETKLNDIINSVDKEDGTSKLLELIKNDMVEIN